MILDLFAKFRLPARAAQGAAVLAAGGLLAGGCGIDPARLVAETARKGAVVLATARQIEKVDVAEGSYIVAFRTDAGVLGHSYGSFLTEYRTVGADLDTRYGVDPRVKTIRYLTALDLSSARAPGFSTDFTPPPALQLAWDEGDFTPAAAALTAVDFVSEGAARAVLAEWEAAGDLWFAEPNYVNRLMQNPYTQEIVQSYTTAAFWWHKSIKLEAALTKLAGMEIKEPGTPVIAVLDSGVDIQHPDLKDRLFVNSNPGASGCGNDVSGCDTTQAFKDRFGSENVAPYLTGGYSQPCPNADKAQSLAPQSKEASELSVCQHGTHVAGIIAAKVGTQVGGVCPVCRVLPIKIIQGVGGSGVALDSAILAAFKYIIMFKPAGSEQKAVRVANASFGKYVRSRAVALIVSILSKAPFEVLVVGAASNEDSMARAYPGALNEAIAVSAVGANDEKADYSNYGPWVDIAAPGGSDSQLIDSTVPGGSYNPKKGTSMATPVVAGVAGLLLSANPRMGFRTLRGALIDHADCRLYNGDVDNGYNRNVYYPKPSGENTRIPLLGSGIVDAAASLETGAGQSCRGSKLVRVTASCGVAGAGGGPVPAGLMLLVPVVVALAGRRRLWTA